MLAIIGKGVLGDLIGRFGQDAEGGPQDQMGATQGASLR